MPHNSDIEVVILNDYASFSGGAASVALHSSLALAARDFKVALFTAVGPVAPVLRKCAHLDVFCSEQHDIAGDPNRFRSFYQGLWNQKAVTGLRRLLASKDPARTIVHVHSWMKALSPGVISTALDRGFPVAITLHDFFAVCPSGGFYLHREKQLCKRRPLSGTCLTCNCDRRNYAHKLWRVARTALQNRWLKIADRVHHYIGVSQFSVDVMKPYLSRKIPVSIVRNPVDCPDYGPAAVDKSSSFVFAGRFVAEKGVDLFADAADRAGVQAVFVGGGELEPELRRRFPRAALAGWLEAAPMTAALRQARALVFPSLWYETLGLSAIEAMANGVPVIVSDRCAAAELVQDGFSGLHFQRGSVESLAVQLRRLCNDDFAARLGRNAYEWYWRDPWSLDAHANQLSCIYKSMLQRR